MAILIIAGVFGLGILLSSWPPVARKLSSFFDTLIHEAGHGLASLPFGAPLPSITVRSNSSGETQSTMGYLHQFLPLGLGVLTEKLARILSLMAGYSASLIFAAFLLVLMPLSHLTLSPWFLFFVAQIALATVLWTLVRITDSPWTFLLVAGAATGIYLLLFPWNWWIYGGIILGAVTLFFFARNFLATLAVILTVSSPLAPVLSLMLREKNPFTELIDSLAITVNAQLFEQIIFGSLLVFLAFCCRSWLSLGLTVLILGGVTGLLFIPGLPSAYVVLLVAGILTGAGVRSLRELYRLTFKAKSTHWQTETTATDMVFAADEIGGDPRYWYWIQLTVAVGGALTILLFGYIL